MKAFQIKGQVQPFSSKKSLNSFWVSTRCPCSERERKKVRISICLQRGYNLVVKTNNIHSNSSSTQHNQALCETKEKEERVEVIIILLYIIITSKYQQIIMYYISSSPQPLWH